MLKISKILLKTNEKLTTTKKKIKNNIEIFKKKVNEEKKQPRSKLKSYLLGFGTVLSIFGVTFFSTSLPANAKDTPPPGPNNPGQIAPAPAKPSDEIVGALAGAAGTVCGLAISSGSFLVGAACGVIIVVGILKVQGK